MKIVQWFPKDVPEEIQMSDDGQWIFDDWPTRFNLEVGDMIQMISDGDWGTRCFYVNDVWPYTEDYDGYCNRSAVAISQ